MRQVEIQHGEIRVAGLSRRFRVRVRGTNTLKSVVLLRSHSRPADVWALRDSATRFSELLLVGVAFVDDPGGQRMCGKDNVP